MINSLKAKSKHLGMRITEDLSYTISSTAQRNNCSVSALSAMALELGMSQILRIERENPPQYSLDLGDLIVREYIKSDDSGLMAEYQINEREKERKTA